MWVERLDVAWEAPLGEEGQEGPGRILRSVAGQTGVGQTMGVHTRSGRFGRIHEGETHLDPLSQTLEKKSSI